jgi:hypothetical protein
MIKRYYKLVDLLTNGYKCAFSYSNLITLEVQPFFDVMNFQPTGVLSGIQPEFRFCPLKIRHSTSGVTLPLCLIFRGQNLPRY